MTLCARSPSDAAAVVRISQATASPLSPNSRDKRENTRKDIVRILYHPVEDACPFAAAEPLQHFCGKRGLRAAIFFSAHDSGERAAADIECAAFVAEPGAASAGACGVALRIAAVGCRAGAYYQDYPLAFADGCIQGDREIGGDRDYSFRKSTFEESGDAFRDGFSAGAADPGAYAANVARFQMMALEDDVGCIAEREPSLGVSGAQADSTVRRWRARGHWPSASIKMQSVFVPPPSKPR